MSKIMQIAYGFCHCDVTPVHPTLEDTIGKYAPDILFVEAPDFVFEGWGYDDTKEGDERFIQPIPPEGWKYDEVTGILYPETEIAPSEMPTSEDQLRAEIAIMKAAVGITFVTLAELGSIDDVTAGEHVDLFAGWKPSVNYTIGNICRYDADLYRCIQTHTSQEDWTPDAAVSLWTKITDPAEKWPEWSQPVGAHDAYNEGDKVSHNGKHWASNVNNNVWEPGVYGWTEAI